MNEPNRRELYRQPVMLVSIALLGVIGLVVGVLVAQGVAVITFTALGVAAGIFVGALLAGRSLRSGSGG